MPSDQSGKLDTKPHSEPKLASEQAEMESNNQIRIQTVEEEHYGGILEFLLDVFRVQEPMCRNRGITREEVLDHFQDLVDDGIKSKVSFVGLDSAGLVVACCLNDVLKTSEMNSQQPPIYKFDKANALVSFVHKLWYDLPMLAPDIDRFFKLGIICVHPGFLRQGLASRLAQSSFDLAKEIGTQAVVLSATAFRSQKLFEKYGFVTISEMAFDEDIVTIDDHCGKLMILRL